MGCLWTLCEHPKEKVNLFNGIIFNNSDYQVQYCICGTKSRTVKETVTKSQGANFKLDVNPVNVMIPVNPNTIGGEITASRNQQDLKEMQEVDTLGQIWIKPHHYSTQGLLNLAWQRQDPIFLSISYFGKDNKQTKLQVNVLVTCKENVSFIVTKDMACEPVNDFQIAYFKKEFNKNLDSGKAYRKQLQQTNQKSRLKDQIAQWLRNQLYGQMALQCTPIQSS